MPPLPADSIHARACKLKCEKILTRPIFFIFQWRKAYKNKENLTWGLPMNYDMNMIKYRKNGFFRIAAAILIICFTLLGLTACAGTTDSKDNNDDNALIQGTWEIDTGSGAGYKFVDDKFMWLKSIENVNDNYWYGDVEYYNGAEAMEIAGLTEEELQSSLPGLKPENIFVTKLDPEKIITDGEDKTATNMNDQTLWTRLWLIEENEDNVVAVVFDLETFSMESYTKVK